MSRYHSVLSCHENDIYIDDTSSKFGTLIKLKNPYLLSEGKHYALQCANSKLDIFVPPTWSLLSCFGINEVSNKEEQDDLEEMKAPPKQNLPGNGKHSVLVVKKKAYNKLLQHDEKVKKGELNKTMCCRAPLCVMPNKNEEEVKQTMQFFRQKTVAHQGKNKTFQKKFENHIDEANMIMFHHGDTADDVNFDDCD